jgi:excisionase family DNA binding protein
MNETHVSSAETSTLSAEGPALPQKLRYTRREAAIQLAVSVRTVDYRVASGELKPVRDGKRVLFTRQELDRFARRDHPAIKPN